MKVHPFARVLWDHEPTTLSLGCKRLRPLVPKLADSTSAAATANGGFDIKSFIRADCGARKIGCFEQKRDSAQVETTPGGTRWNPTQEQIRILETLYRGGMRTPNTQQIEQITAQLGKFGKIEGKNVFYWFQNHKARERQRQKRNNLGLSPSPRIATSTTTIMLNTREGEEKEEDSPYKRKCMTWIFKCSEEDASFYKEDGNKTLELFPLHPEGR